MPPRCGTPLLLTPSSSRFKHADEGRPLPRRPDTNQCAFFDSSPPSPFTLILRARCLVDTSLIPIVDGAYHAHAVCDSPQVTCSIPSESVRPLPPPKSDRRLTPSIDRTTASVMRGRYATPTSMTTMQAYSTRLVDGSPASTGQRHLVRPPLDPTGLVSFDARPRVVPLEGNAYTEMKHKNIRIRNSREYLLIQ